MERPRRRHPRKQRKQGGGPPRPPCNNGRWGCPQLQPVDSGEASQYAPRYVPVGAGQYQVPMWAELLPLPTDSAALSPPCAAVWSRKLELLAQAAIAELVRAQGNAAQSPGVRFYDPGGGSQAQRAHRDFPRAAQEVAVHKRNPLKHFLEVAGPVWDNVIAFCGTPREIFGAFMVTRYEDICGDWYCGHPQWQVIFYNRWPAMHCALRYARERAWMRTFAENVKGMRSCLLEVFDRERKLGFAMSAHPAICRWDQRRSSYVAKYLSVSDVPEEYIPYEEGSRRLRFCPPSAQQGISCPYSGGIDPFRVLPMNASTLEQLQAALPQGQGIELQWKMRAGGPFGWWYAEVESVEVRGDRFHATLLFRHFPESSPWYRLLVPVCITTPETCAIGGFCGGLRRCTPEEQAIWRQHLDNPSFQ